jgi:alpha-L-rhamnosidase
MEIKIQQIRFEHLEETLGIGTTHPRLTWVIESEVEGWLQAGYEIEAYTHGGHLYGQTGRIDSTESVLIPWPFAPLASRLRLTVRVQAWSTDGRVTMWSIPASVEAGLLNVQDWTARFVSPDWEEDTSQAQPGPLLRREFNLQKEVKQARLYITALGLYEAYLNGTVVGDQVMAPGWTSYHNRLRYQTFDVTRMVQKGQNAIGVMLGDGWFRGRFGFNGGQANIYGDRLGLLTQLEVEYQDGTTEQIVSDENWRAVIGPILLNDIYDGETYDARLERPGWTSPNYDDADWAGVRRIDWDLTTLFAPMGPPVRRIQLVSPQAITISPSGRTILDFGQNLVGRLRISVKGKRGQTITLRHAEVLENGELCIRPLRHAKATDHYTLKGGSEETYEPYFTFHGFRYAEIVGWLDELKSEDVQAVVCHSDMERSGWFECSNPLINRLHENAVWSMRGNFLDIPTDCPQRDERLGWTGDIQVFSPTASFLFNSAGFLSSWLVDLAVEQKESGVVPFFVPRMSMSQMPPTAAWGDAAVIIPWVLYQRFRDVKILSDQYESMRTWVDLIASIAGEKRLWDQGFQFGDWLDPTAPTDNPGKAQTPGFLVATAYFAHSAEILGQAARVLGHVDEADYYLQLADEVRLAFNREYVTPTGRLLSDSATAYALSLQFALLPNQVQREHAGARLAALVRANGFCISTGFVGTPLICDALCSVGLEETAFRLLTQQECPSWLYPVTMGATTIWERWDSLLPDGAVNPGEMTSFNHYALGAIVDWLHRFVAGLSPATPGYQILEFNPHPGGGLTSASTRHLTPYGMASCSWRIEEDHMFIEVVVPPNTLAKVKFPGKVSEEAIEVGSGRHTWTYAYQVNWKKHKVLTLDSTIGEVIDDPEVFERVTKVLQEFPNELVRSIMHHENLTLRQAIGIIPTPSGFLEKLEKALADK